MAEPPRAFYTRWYRLDRLAPVVVGDFDPSAIEQSLIPPITATEVGGTEERRRRKETEE